MRGSYLEPGERIRLEERPHAASLMRPFAKSLVAAVVGLILVVAAPSTLGLAGALLLGAAALQALAAVWRWDRTVLVVTTDKLFITYGIAQRRAAAVRLARVGPVEMQQGLLGRVLGYGTVTAGDLEIPYVPDPAKVCSLAG